jgi:hypothetical protein
METESDRVHATGHAPGTVMISLTHPRGSNDDQRRVGLKVEDLVSSQVLVNVEMTAEQFADMMSSAATVVAGARLPQHPERLGKRMHTASTPITRTDGRDPQEVAAAYLAEGWETVSVHQTNYGQQVVARRWVADSEGGT